MTNHPKSPTKQDGRSSSPPAAPERLKPLTDEELNGTMAAAQISYSAQCPIELDTITIMRLCQELHDVRADLARAPAEVVHWMLVLRASATACGIERGKPSAQDPPTTRLEDYVTCPDCQQVIVGYKFGRAAARAPKLQNWATTYLADWLCEKHDVMMAGCWGCERQQQMKEILDEADLARAPADDKRLTEIRERQEIRRQREFARDPNPNFHHFELGDIDYLLSLLAARAPAPPEQDAARKAAEEIAAYIDGTTPLTVGGPMVERFIAIISRHFSQR